MSNNGYDGAFVWKDGNQRKLTITFADYKKKAPVIVNIENVGKPLIKAYCKKYYGVLPEHIEFQDD